MAIQFRRGLFANLDKSKLVAGEPVVALDNDKDYVGIAKGANDVIELATKEALDNKVIANPTGTASDSLTKIAIDGEVYNVEGSGSYEEITYAQYQALTPAQKNDGTVRYVEDYPASVTGATIHYGTTDIGVGATLPTGDIYIVYE